MLFKGVDPFSRGHINKRLVARSDQPSPSVPHQFQALTSVHGFAEVLVEPEESKLMKCQSMSDGLQDCCAPISTIDPAKWLLHQVGQLKLNNKLLQDVPACSKPN